MLVLGRKLNEKILIGDDIVLTIVDIEKGKVRIGIVAPADTRIDRAEIRERRDAERETQAVS